MGRPRAKDLSRPDYPYTVKLSDGRSIYMEVPGCWMTEDRDGSPAFLPEAVTFVDRSIALSTPVNSSKTGPTPGYITALRDALGMTQAQLGKAVGVDAMTVSRWERGTLRPGPESLKALERLRKRMIRKGVVIPS